MKQTLESAAINELFFSYACTSRNISFAGLVYDRNAMLNMFRKGAEWHAKQSPWISVEDRLPDNQDIVLVRDEYDRFCTAYLHGKNSRFITYGEDAYNFFGEITHWMPIPKFDEILEANRDVLERIKEKGD